MEIGARVKWLLINLHFRARKYFRKASKKAGLLYHAGSHVETRRFLAKH